MPTIEPFVRWAGGKTWLISHIPELLGDLHIEHYHEPFLGGGAIFFSLDHTKKSYLSDANPQLIKVENKMLSHLHLLEYSFLGAVLFCLIFEVLFSSAAGVPTRTTAMLL